jgi:hypothetical protein
MLMPATALAQNPADAAVGDVFVAVQAVPPGSTLVDNVYEVWHNSGTASKPSFSLLQTMIGNGSTAGCALDSAYRLFGTDSTNSQALRFAIDNADDVLPTPNPIVATISPSATNALRGTKGCLCLVC